MSDDNWRTVKKKGGGGHPRENGNWRNRDGTEENKHFLTRSGFSRENARQTSTRTTYSRTTNPNFARLPPQGIMPYQNRPSSNNMLNSKFLYDLIENQTLEHITGFLITNMEEFSKTMATDLSEDIFIALLKLAAKACENSFVSSKSYMLKITMQKKFVTTVCSFFSGFATDERNDPDFWKNISTVLDCVLILLENSMQLIPMTCWEYVQTIIKTLSLVLPLLLKGNKIQLSSNYESRVNSLKDDLVKIESKFKKETPTPTISNYNENDADAEKAPTDDYRYQKVYPKTNELVVPDRPYVRKNIVNGKFPSVRDYLDIHFRLLREDFLNPLRQDICDFLNNSRKHLFNIKIHRNARFLKLDVIQNIVAHEVQFELSKGLERVISSGEHKRFMHGTMLLFSDDDFKSIHCGKVVNNNNLNQGSLFVDIYGYYMPISYTKTYTMIECIIFFEPYYQVLSVFQRLPQNRLPMEKYIVNVETNISHPKYMEQVKGYQLPKDLNPSQASALHAALNKEFVIIQGPPGTGKTFLGMKFIKMLLSLKRQCPNDFGPILIVTFTNHALEQFLDGLKDYTSKMVRLGRNSNDLRDAYSKYGPEALLENFLINNGLIDDYYEESDFDDFLDDFEFWRPTDKLECRRRDIKRFIKKIIGKADWKNERYFILHQLGRVNEDDVPDNIRYWLRSKHLLNNHFKYIKSKENEIKYIKSEIRQLEDKENVFVGLFLEKCSSSKEDWLDPSLINKARENVAEYYFQNIQLLCWLLCDDGTISWKQNKDGDDKVRNPIEEENEVQNLLTNLVYGAFAITLGCEQVDIEERIYISRLIQICFALSKFIKHEKGLREEHRRIFQRQLKFLQEKIEYLKFCLETDFGHPDEDAPYVADPFLIPSKTRWQLYKSWISVYKINLDAQLSKLLDSYQETYATYSDLREMDNVKLLKSMDIVAMTTTCAARLRSTLEALKSPVVVVEEAAEVLESHIVTALTADCQHLILIGDHQQLRPTTSDYTIEKKYKLGISLFERMVQNNVECHTLNEQHRMRPEISSLISPLFYKELLNHSSVEKYPSISGVQYPLYFIDHMEPEELYGDSSKMNGHEAKFLIQLAIYLLHNDYKPKDITILAAYLGQMYELKKEQQKSAHKDVHKIRIAVVDNFQGEENKIILLSLVRNNPDNNIGFLSIDNRVCVALSRAKHGLYIMGNMDQLCHKSEIWKSIRTTLEAQNAISRFLPLRCKNHADHMTLVSKDTDFLKVPQGGCDQPCKTLLDCGHYCVKICHGFDTEHKLYNCEEKCSRPICSNEAHICRKPCFEDCGLCNYSVQRHLACGHEKTLACHVVYEKYICREPKEIEPECGHTQTISCFEDISEFICQVQVERLMPDCQHLQTMPCGQEMSQFLCQVKVQRKLPECEHEHAMLCSQDISQFKCLVNVERKMPDCQHEQAMLCYQDISQFICQVNCERLMPKCQHLQTMACSQNIDQFKCKFMIEITLNCGHKKETSCGVQDTNTVCQTACETVLACGHKCPQKCHAGADPMHLQYKCEEPCTKNLKCCNNPETHGKCNLNCFENCNLCQNMVFLSYTDCSHIERLMCPDATISRKCRRPCAKKLQCGHLCENKCSELCSNCHQYTFKTIPNCGHTIKTLCSKTPLQQNCKKNCIKVLDCGHICKNLCNEPCMTECFRYCSKVLDCGHKCIKKCNETCCCKTEVIPECGHSITVKCGEDISAKHCETMLRRTLPCGHAYHKIVKCNTPISELECMFQMQITLPCGHKATRSCSALPDSIKCEQKCTKLLDCGHSCRELCFKPCSANTCIERCIKKIECGHPCQTLCSQPCTLQTKCLSACDKILKCGHKCQKKCYQPCTDVCAEDCQKILKCGHKCSNGCGEECSENCTVRCRKVLPCGHHCHKPCGAPAPHGCRETCARHCKKTLSCGHACKELCGQPCNQQCLQPCKKVLKCGHQCKNKCMFPCSSIEECNKRCIRNLPCNHVRCTNLCNEPCIECNKKCDKILECGHTCINLCHENCACAIVRSTDCAHYVRANCKETPTKEHCTQVCNKLLDCGHYCKQQCNIDCLCLESCRKRLKCGCLCIKASCSDICECRNKCFVGENEE